MDDLTPLIRTGFSSNSKWLDLKENISVENEHGFKAYVKPISEVRFSNISTSELLKAFNDQILILVADKHALDTGQVLCIYNDRQSLELRAHTRDLWMVENNVSTANMDFEEFLEHTLNAFSMGDLYREQLFW